MILKIVEGVSSKDTFHVAKITVNLSIFSKLPFFNYNFLKLPQKLKKPSVYVPLQLICMRAKHFLASFDARRSKFFSYFM